MKSFWVECQSLLRKDLSMVLPKYTVVKADGINHQKAHLPSRWYKQIVFKTSSAQKKTSRVTLPLCRKNDKTLQNEDDPKIFQKIR